VTPLILASASPRRRELLSEIGLSFTIDVPGLDERAFAVDRPHRLARRIATAKAREVAARRRDSVVLAADTVVINRGRVLGKPPAPAEAREMLTALRGRKHRVFTAVAVLAPGRARPAVDHVRTLVTMRGYSDTEIEASIQRGDPFDKAGAYAIQDSVLVPVAAYQGCYCNVVGLPLWTTLRLLLEAGLAVDASRSSMPAACEGCPAAKMSPPRRRRQGGGA
jgi:MAF protein